MDYILAFIVGGLICVIVQILMDNTKLLPGRIMVLLVCSGAVLGPSVCTSHLPNGQEQGRRFPCLALEMSYIKE